MAQRFWQRAPLALLLLLNLGSALWVTFDLYHRLADLAAPTPTATARPIPTAIPAPTLARRPTPSPRPTSPRPTATLAAPTPAPTPAGLPAVLIADDRFAYADLDAGQVQAFLESQGSVLARARVPVGTSEDTFAHALVGHCLRYSLNPRVLLALVEVQSGLVRAQEDPEGRLEWAFGYRDPQWSGLDMQLQWATSILADGFRESDRKKTPLLNDGTLAPIPAEANAATQALLRLLAQTSDRKRFSMLRSSGPGSFLAAYQELFGQDPRLPLEKSWEPAREPFLWPPFAGSAAAVSYFDHEYPTFRANGSILPYSGERGYQSYDGHDGWDYALSRGTPVLAAAAGTVIFAGRLDTLCSTPAQVVVLDHGQGYRTLYWHLETILVEERAAVAQGQPIGTVGSTGCSTGPHLHFGVEFLGRDTDPYGWCGSAGVPEDPWAKQAAGTVSRWLWADRPSPCPVPAGAVAVDDRDAGFHPTPALWNEAPVGHADHAFWTLAISDTQKSAFRAVWQPELPEAGRYFLYAYIPWYDTGHPDTAYARYRIRHANGETTVEVDQAHATGLWVPLGRYYFAAGGRGYVYLDEVTADPGTTVWFDAVVWVKD